MTGPDNGETSVEVAGQLRVLRYPCGAVYALQKQLGDESGIQGAGGLVGTISPETLALFVWAGLLHEDRKLKLKDIREAIDWGDGVPIVELYNAVVIAWQNSITGSFDAEVDLPEEGKASRSLGKRFTSTLSGLFSRAPRTFGGDGPSPTAPPAS
jgi:hypothetical protein